MYVYRLQKLLLLNCCLLFKLNAVSGRRICIIRKSAISVIEKVTTHVWCQTERMCRNIFKIKANQTNWVFQLTIKTNFDNNAVDSFDQQSAT